MPSVKWNSASCNCETVSSPFFLALESRFWEKHKVLVIRKITNIERIFFKLNVMIILQILEKQKVVWKLWSNQQNIISCNLIKIQLIDCVTTFPDEIITKFSASILAKRLVSRLGKKALSLKYYTPQIHCSSLVMPKLWQIKVWKNLVFWSLEMDVSAKL